MYKTDKCNRLPVLFLSLLFVPLGCRSVSAPTGQCGAQYASLPAPRHLFPGRWQRMLCPLRSVSRTSVASRDNILYLARQGSVPGRSPSWTPFLLPAEHILKEIPTYGQRPAGENFARIWTRKLQGRERRCGSFYFITYRGLIWAQHRPYFKREQQSAPVREGNNKRPVMQEFLQFIESKCGQKKKTGV